MGSEPLTRRLRRLKRTVEQLDACFAEQRVDTGLLAEIDLQLENGLAADPRTADLKGLLDDLRESTLAPRPERYADGVVCCRRVKAAIEGLMAVV